MTFAFTPVPSQDDIQTALRTVLLGIVPAGVEVIAAQDDDVPEPTGDFITINILRRPRLATNIDGYADCAFTGSITGNTLTVQAMRIGALAEGRLVYNTGAATPPTIVAVTSPTTATLSQSLTASSRPMAAGAKLITQKTEIVFQLDVHSSDSGRSSDMAQAISTVLRDDTGVQLFSATGLPVTPLHADDPRQMPFVNAEQNYEDRYVVECHVQADQVLTPTQEFADTVEIDRVAADLFFPA